MRPTIQRLARAGRRQDGGMIARTDAKLEKAGYPGGLRGADWVGVKFLGLIIFAILGFALGLALTAGTFVAALLFAFRAAGLGYMAPEFWLGRKIRARSMAMTLQLPDALDLLTISHRSVVRDGRRVRDDAQPHQCDVDQPRDRQRVADRLPPAAPHRQASGATRSAASAAPTGSVSQNR